MSGAARKKVCKKITKWCSEAFGGSGDFEKDDAVNITDWLTSRYAGQKDVLADTFEAVKKRLQVLDPGWVYRRAPVATDVPAPPAEGQQSDACRLSPRQLGFEVQYSMKGKSKMIHIMECLENFMEEPYDSQENPMLVKFSPESAGQPIEDFSVVVRIGYAKSLAAKAICLAIVELMLQDDELVMIQACVQALFSVRAVFQSNVAGDKDQEFATLRKKFEEANRPRPDPIQIVYMFQNRATREAKRYGDVVSSYITEFNGGSNVEGKQLSDLEQAVVTLIPELTKKTQAALEYHWDNFKARQSGMPLNHVGARVVIHGAKPRAEQKCELWDAAIAAGPLAREHYVLRRIGIFCANLQDAKRLGKRVNLKSHSEALRDKYSVEDAWELSALFAYFYPQFEKAMTEVKAKDLVRKFMTGYLDQELHEKCKTKLPVLEWRHFRFLTSHGVEGVISVQMGLAPLATESDSISTQWANLMQWEKKLEKEEQAWSGYQYSLKVFRAASQSQFLDLRDKAWGLQKTAVETNQGLRFPVKACENAAEALIFASACTGQWCDALQVPKTDAYTIFLVNCPVAGARAQEEFQHALTHMIAPTLAANPERTCAVVLAPNVGTWGNMFHEDEIRKHCDEIENFMKGAANRVVFTRIVVRFTPSTVPQKCNRPDVHNGWLLLSDQVSTAGPSPKLKSEFIKSWLWIRRSTDTGSMLLATNMVDPLTDFHGLPVHIADKFAGKPARRRQWLAGWEIHEVIHSALWKGMVVDPAASAATWIDVFGYDHSLIECIMRTTVKTCPREQVVSTIWAELIVRGELERDPKACIQQWLKTQTRRKLLDAVKEKRVVIDGWVPTPEKAEDGGQRPTYNLQSFELCFPSAVDLLPIRQTAFEMAEAKFTGQDARKRFMDIVEKHNKAWNPTGHVHGEKRAAEKPESSERPTKQAKVIAPPSDGPADLDGLEKQRGKYCIYETQGQKVAITLTGELWIFGLKDGEVNDSDAMALVWGGFKMGEEGKKLLESVPLRAWQFLIKDANHEGGYTITDAPPEQSYPPQLGPLSMFLDHLESNCEVDLNNTTFACHKLQAAAKKDEAGDVVDRVYTINCTEETCAYKPNPTPRKSNALWEDAGSHMCSGSAAGNWDWKTGLHIGGNLRLVDYLKHGVSEQQVGIFPDKIAIYLTAPVKITKDTLIRLA